MSYNTIFKIDLISKYPNTQVQDTLRVFENIIIYHARRKVFRVYKSNLKTKWNKVLGYCSRSEEYTEDRYMDRYLDEYEIDSTYEVYCTNDDISDLRTIEDLRNRYAEYFI